MRLDPITSAPDGTADTSICRDLTGKPASRGEFKERIRLLPVSTLSAFFGRHFLAITDLAHQSLDRGFRISKPSFQPLQLSRRGGLCRYRTLFDLRLGNLGIRSAFRGVWSPTVQKRTRTIKNCLLNRLIDNVVYELLKTDIKDSYLALISVSRMF